MSLSTIIVILLVILVLALVGLYVFYNRDDRRFTLDIGGAAPRAAGGNDSSAEHTVRNRLLGLGLACTGLVAGLIARLWSMQLVASDEYVEQAESNRTRSISIAAPRGRILDRYGNELVGNRPSLTVVSKPEVADKAIEVQLLANLIGMPAAAVRRKIQDQSSGAQSDRTVASDVSRRVVAFIGEHPYLFEGITVEERSVRSYPFGRLAAHVVGYTGPVTTELLEESSKDVRENAIVYEAGDTVGQAGVELEYESVLQGIRGEQRVYVDASGSVLEYSTSVEPQPGSDVILTLDAKLQQAAEDSLERVMREIRKSKVSPNCVAGSVIVMDVTNGEILAMASAPSYSPNIFVGGISNDDWDMLQSEKSDNPLMNRAVAGLYPSASTIKPVMAFAALDNGIATDKSDYECTGWWTGFGVASGQYCWERSGHGHMTLQSGISFSCDVVFYEIGKGFFESDNPEGMQEKLREWGLGQATGIDLPGEAIGRVPDAEWKYNYYTEAAEADRQWKGGDFANLAIGQGDLLVTPIQLTSAFAGIAMKGEQWRPHVLKSVRSSTGSGSVVDYEPQVLRSIDEADDYVKLVHAGMVGAVYEESEFIAQIFGTMKEKVAAKSGTAERIGHNPTAWYLCFAPADDPKYVVAANIEEATWASSSALYVARDVLGAIYGEPSDATIYISPVDIGG